MQRVDGEYLLVSYDSSFRNIGCGAFEEDFMDVSVVENVKLEENRNIVARVDPLFEHFRAVCETHSLH